MVLLCTDCIGPTMYPDVDPIYFALTVLCSFLESLIFYVRESKCTSVVPTMSLTISPTILLTVHISLPLTVSPAMPLKI
jgi:hypothetical protein